VTHGLHDIDEENLTRRMLVPNQKSVLDRALLVMSLTLVVMRSSLRV
jgi:hypothetical protein